MWYHPSVFALGWRDIVAAWIVCFAAAALLFCYGLSAAEEDADPRFAAARSTISQKSFIAEAIPADEFLDSVANKARARQVYSPSRLVIMEGAMGDEISCDKPARAGVSRRGALQCLAWAGTGLVWTVSGGVPRALGLGEANAAEAPKGADFTFVQISDSHIGFKADANPDPNGTLQLALDRIGKLPKKPAFMLHTGDVTHLSKPEEFDTADQILKGAKLDAHYVPGEHDVIGDDGKQFFARFAKEATQGGWYSFDHGGVHFVALINVMGFKPGAGGTLGADQLAWLDKDLKARGDSTPIVVMAHMPLWSIYPQWGWATEDAADALGLMKRFGSVTVLNGHIHQVVQKVEEKVSFRTAMSTAFPQPPAGEGKGPGPLKVEPDKLKTVLGVREIEYAPAKGLGISDATLA